VLFAANIKGIIRALIDQSPRLAARRDRDRQIAASEKLSGVT